MLDLPSVFLVVVLISLSVWEDGGYGICINVVTTPR